MTDLHPQSNQAKMSRRILTAIRKNPATFNMSSWYHGDRQFVLRASEKPACGTTMCLAGWAAHYDGWTLDKSGGAIKPGSPQRSIAAVGLDALDLVLDDDDLFHTLDDVAVACLMRMASGEAYSETMLDEESDRSHDFKDRYLGNQDPTDLRVRLLLGLDTPATVMAR